MNKQQVSVAVNNIMNDKALTADQKTAAIAKLLDTIHERQDRALSFKVSAKQALSVYGLGRFPVTLYPNQWAKLIAAVQGIEAFIEANKDSLSFAKGDASKPMTDKPTTAPVETPVEEVSLATALKRAA